MLRAEQKCAKCPMTFGGYCRYIQINSDLHPPPMGSHYVSDGTGIEGIQRYIGSI